MKLKLIFASLSVFGLMSNTVLAENQQVVGSGHVKQTVSAVEASSVSSLTLTRILDEMTQNVGMAKPMPEWFNRIGISGGINFDTLKWGSRTAANQAFVVHSKAAIDENPFNTLRAGYAGENTLTYSLNPAYLNVTADINEYAKAFAMLSYTGASANYDQAYLTSPEVNLETYNNQAETLVLEQAFMRISNLDCYPVFAEVGKQFQDFGRYPSHPITESMTQVLSEALRTALKLGFIDNKGLNGSVYLFQDPMPKFNAPEHSLNYGVAAGFSHPNNQVGYEVGIGYLYNMFGVNNIAADVENSLIFAGGWHTRVGGIAAYADLNTGPFTFSGRYTAALRRFSPNDIVKSVEHPTTGAKPWAAGLQAGYGFNAWDKNQNIYLGYQLSRDTIYLNLPQGRWEVGYGMEVLKNTSLIAQWDHDISYPIVQGGATQGSTNLVSLRAAVKFG